MENGVETGGVAPKVGVCPVGTLEPGVLCAMMKSKSVLEEFLLWCSREGCDGGASDISLAGELSNQGLAPAAPDGLVFRLSRLTDGLETVVMGRSVPVRAVVYRSNLSGGADLEAQ